MIFMDRYTTTESVYIFRGLKEQTSRTKWGVQLYKLVELRERILWGYTQKGVNMETQGARVYIQNRGYREGLHIGQTGLHRKRVTH